MSMEEMQQRCYWGIKMKTANSISGGRTSGYLAVHYPADYNVFSLVCIDDPDCAPKDPSIIQYVNDKIGSEYIDQYGEFIATTEDDLTLYAMRDLEQLLGREIIWVRGKSFDDIIDTPHYIKGMRTLIPNKYFRYCTENLKLEPIFHWWFKNIGEKVNMRIGFRFDEFDRIERFMNKGDSNLFKIPVACSTKGQRKQKFETFNWRMCSFPLAKAGITNEVIKDYWRDKWVKNDLFEQRKIVFPEVSNCVHCFWKKIETLSIMAAMHPTKMKWAARQEDKGKGTWLPSGIRYDSIIENAQDWIPEMLKENGAACDSGGCHD